MSCIKRRKSRRKFQHQPADIDALNNLLTQGSGVYAKKTIKALENACKKADHDVVGGSRERKGRSRSKAKSRWWNDTKSRKSVSSSDSSKSTSSCFSTNSSQSSSGSHKARKSASSKYTLKRRASIEEDNDLNDITFRLGNVTYKMDGLGNWKTTLKHSTLKEEISQLAALNLKISQENNMLRVKNELLLDMIAKKNLRKEKVDAELKRLRKLLSSSSYRFSDDPKHKKSQD